MTCALIRYSQVYPLSTKCISADMVKTHLETWFKDYCAPKETFSDKDLLFQLATGWYKRVQTAPNVGFHTVDTLCSKQKPWRLPPMHEHCSEDGEKPRLGEADTLGETVHQHLKKFQKWIQPS